MTVSPLYGVAAPLATAKDLAVGIVGFACGNPEQGFARASSVMLEAMSFQN